MLGDTFFAGAPPTAATAGDEREGATKWQMVFNVLNLYVGLGLLSQGMATPSQGYGFAKGGWATAGLLTLCAAMFLWTGKLIVRCFASLDAERYADCG
eukprot:gene3755-30120_t